MAELFVRLESVLEATRLCSGGRGRTGSRADQQFGEAGCGDDRSAGEHQLRRLLSRVDVARPVSASPVISTQLASLLPAPF